MEPENRQAVISQLEQLLNDYVRLSWQQNGTLPRIEFDEAFQSPAQTGNLIEEEICWHPVIQQDVVDFSGIEDALEISLPESGKCYWSSYFSGNVGVEIDGMIFELLQPWNPEDLVNFQENLVGHLLLQRKRRIAPTIFIGCGVDNERILSVDMQGRVVWEWPGDKKQVELAPDLCSFLQSCEVSLLS